MLMYVMFVSASIHSGHYCLRGETIVTETSPLTAFLLFGAIEGMVELCRLRDNSELMVTGMGTVTETGESGGVIGTANGFGTG